MIGSAPSRSETIRSMRDRGGERERPYTSDDEGFSPGAIDSPILSEPEIGSVSDRRDWTKRPSLTAPPRRLHRDACRQ